MHRMHGRSVARGLPSVAAGLARRGCGTLPPAGRVFAQGSRQEYRDASVKNRLLSNLVTPLNVEYK